MTIPIIELEIGCSLWKQQSNIVFKIYTPVGCGWFEKNFSSACFVSSRRRCWNSLTQLETVETISRAAWLDSFSTTTGFSAGFKSLFLITLIFALAVIVVFLLYLNFIILMLYESDTFEVESNSHAFPLSNPSARLCRLWKLNFAFSSALKT